MSFSSLVLSPKDEVKAGIVFYTGAYVNKEAYLPLLMPLASKGMTCCIDSGFLQLPLLTSNSASKHIQKYSDIESWFIAGHSMGAVAANSYIRKNFHEKNIKGIIYLGGFAGDRYSLNHIPLPILSIYGSNDVLIGKIKSDEKNFPNDSTIVEIEGGNHGFFGSYGFHFLNGIASVTREKQMKQAQISILEFIEKHCNKP